MKYIYTASTQDGEIKKGFIEALSLRAVKDSLIKQGFLVVSIEEKKKIFLKFPSLTLLGGVGGLEKLIFTKHFSVMLKSGVDIIEALEALKKQSSSFKLKKILQEIISSVSSGQKFSDSLAKYPKIFSDFYVNTIRAGEAGGTLDKNLEYLAEQMNKDYDLKRKIKNAMAYPTIVLVATVVIALSLAIFILPKITKLFKAFTVPLPLTTRILLWLADFLGEHGFLVIIGLIFLILSIRWFSRLKSVKPYLDRTFLRLPIAGQIIQNINLSRFSRALGSLLKSGLPITAALKVTAKTLDNASYQKNLMEIEKEIQKGAALASLLEKRKKFFPVTVSQMVATGEATGKLEGTLFYLAEFYEAETDGAIKNLATLIEPILLIFIGLLVGGVALAIISPIYQITGQLGQ